VPGHSHDAELAPFTASVVVPGHGAPVDRAFVLAQHAELTRLDWLIRDGDADGAPAEAVAARAPFGRPPRWSRSSGGTPSFPAGP
jgi:hypothetical protein